MMPEETLNALCRDIRALEQTAEKILAALDRINGEIGSLRTHDELQTQATTNLANAMREFSDAAKLIVRMDERLNAVTKQAEENEKGLKNGIQTRVTRCEEQIKTLFSKTREAGAGAGAGAGFLTVIAAEIARYMTH